MAVGDGTAFPDLHVAVEQMIAEGDLVVARVVRQGTHQGEFIGISPTGQRVRVMGIDICRIAKGKIAEHWGQLDVVSFLQQLHLMPIPLGTRAWYPSSASSWGMDSSAFGHARHFSALMHVRGNRE